MNLTIFPAQEVDVAQAFAWTYHHIAEYGGNPANIFVMGHSSGWMLVSLLGTDRSRSRNNRPVALSLVSAHNEAKGGLSGRRSHHQGGQLLVGEVGGELADHRAAARLGRRVYDPHQHRPGKPPRGAGQAHGQQGPQLDGGAYQEADGVHRDVQDPDRPEVLDDRRAECTGRVGVDGEPLNCASVYWLSHAPLPLTGHSRQPVVCM